MVTTEFLLLDTIFLNLSLIILLFLHYIYWINVRSASEICEPFMTTLQRAALKLATLDVLFLYNGDQNNNASMKVFGLRF